MEQVDCIVVGAGVIGLAVARALALAGRDVLVLEQAGGVGSGASSRNSEVIHAGLYYRPGSLKATLCVRGNRLLYAYLGERGIAHDQCGKFIVATSALQLDQLHGIRANAERCGVHDLTLLTPAQLAHAEPALRAVAALYSPCSGILDSHAFMLSLQGDAEHAGALFAFRSSLVAASCHADGIDVHIEGAGAMSLRARQVVNCTGLAAPALARAIAGMPLEAVPQDAYAKGSYFSVSGPCPFSHLIYPVPEPGGLGVHLTLDLGGQARFGPDVEWVDQPDYAVQPARADRFYAAIRQYWPALPDHALQPAYAGVRPKIRLGGVLQDDFLISGPREHGIAGLTHLFGFESPGLTAALAIGERVAAGITGQTPSVSRQT